MARTLETRGMELQARGFNVWMTDDEGHLWSCYDLQRGYDEGNPRPIIMGWEIVKLEVHDPMTGTDLVIRSRGEWPCIRGC